MTEGHEELRRLLEKVYRNRGFDFREYKETTLTRRLGRRLRARGAETYADYALVLDADPAEYDKLFDDLTINVTDFFRDEVAFQALEKIVLPELIRGARDTGQGASSPFASLRIWAAGCATGQEPYSIAMLLLETLGTREMDEFQFTILGTDIDRKALARAREGVFQPDSVTSIRPALLERYFTRRNDKGDFLVKEKLRRLVTFEEHNLVSDPPYRDLDLAVCRNVIIYFARPLQERVMMAFYQALKPGGFLLLGRAEIPVGKAAGLFRCLDGKAKVYRK